MICVPSAAVESTARRVPGATFTLQEMTPGLAQPQADDLPLRIGQLLDRHPELRDNRDAVLISEKFALGVDILENCEVTGIRRDAGEVHVLGLDPWAADRSFRAEHLPESALFRRFRQGTSTREAARAPCS